MRPDIDKMFLTGKSCRAREEEEDAMMRVRWREGVGRLVVTNSARVHARAVCVCVCGVVGSPSLLLSAEER